VGRTLVGRIRSRIYGTVAPRFKYGRANLVIHVNAVAPGPVITVLQPATHTAKNMEGWGVGTPLHGCAGQPAELGLSSFWRRAIQT
jgi:hypothetical protein